MLKERLKTRKLHSKLIEIQLLECMLLLLLFVLSYDIAWGIVYHNYLPFFIINDHLRHISFSILVIAIFSFYKSFNIFESSYSNVIKKTVMSGISLNAFFIVLLYFVSDVKLTVPYFIVSSAIQVVLIMVLKFISSFFRLKTIQKSINLVIIEDFNSGSGLLKDLRKQCRGKMFVVSSNDENLKKYVTNADNIYLAGTVAKFKSKVQSYCAMENKIVYIIPDIFEIAVRNSTIDYIGDTPVFTMQCYQLTESQRLVKRLEDIVLSVLGIILAVPIFLFVFIKIKHEDGGPLFYTQERFGLNGKPFQMIKFRSMVVDAEKDTGAVLAVDNDHRITKFGSLMRATRIDEIPQFFNVLMGSMSFVGPRPERPVFVEEYSKQYPEYQYRQAVKPGITGLAQVRGNYTTSAEKKIKFDLIYIINYSLLLDVKILLQTVKVVFCKEQSKGFVEKNSTKHFIADLDSVEPERSILSNQPW